MPIARRCTLAPDLCIDRHIAPVLKGREGSEGQWSARCPAHTDSKPSLSIRVGDSGLVIWNCHARCDPADVWRAMLAKHISLNCIPFRPSRPQGDAAGANALAEVERIISEDGDNRQRMRIRIGMVLWNCDRHTAARKLGISQATAYRVQD